MYEAQPITEDGGEPQPPDADDMISLQRIIEKRVNASGLGEPIIQILGEDRLLIQLPGVDDPERAKRLIGETARLEFKHRQLIAPRNLATEGIIGDADIVNVTVEPIPEELLPDSEAAEVEPEEAPIPVIVIEFTPDGAAKFDDILAKLMADFQIAAANANIFTFQSQLDAGVLPSLKVTISGNELIDGVVAPPGVSKLDGTNRYVFPYPQPRPPAPTQPGETPTPLPPDDLAMAQAKLGDAATVVFIEQPGRLDEDFGLGGDNLSRAYSSLHASSQQPIINLEFDSLGTRLFGEKTTEIAGSTTDSIAIFLDGRELIAPIVRQPITTGTAIVEGGFTLLEAQDIALQLEGGRLPFPITLIQERSVDAILGSDSLAKSVLAGVVGLVLVFLFMTLYYRVPGLVASVALVIYAALVLAIFKMLPVTLTLSGVAATILSVGMAVDANVLIFERMKDELRNGRTLISAINIGFNRAWPAIRDSNVSTLITCAILYYFSNQLGTTIVQGFAATLAIGVMVSMFSAIVVSRTILRVLASTRLSRLLGAFVPTGASELPQQTATAARRGANKLDFVGKRNWFFLFSFIVILPGVVFLIINPGLRMGIDFTGGSTVTIKFSNPVTQEGLRTELARIGQVDATVQSFGENTYFIRTRQLSDQDKAGLVNMLEASLSPDGVDVSSDFVSPVVARDTILNGIYAVIAAAVGIFIYLWWAFRSVPRPFRYGIAALVALVHDLLIVVGIFAILGNLLGLEVNTMFLVAVLTVIGYSVNDTIVVFDRLRENVINYGNRGFGQNVNVSISETIGRSLNTSLTLLIVLAALLLFGGATIRTFLLVLIIGVVAGTYSSIAVASQVLVAWEDGVFGRMVPFRRSAA